MADILDEAYALAQCRECPWYRTCVTPMRFTEEDIRRQIESSMPGMGFPQQADMGLQNLMASMASSAQNSLLEACPVFINRLRNSPKLAERIKKIMQEYGSEETEG